MWAPAHPISEADVRQLIVGKRRFFKMLLANPG